MSIRLGRPDADRLLRLGNSHQEESCASEELSYPPS